VVGVGERKGRRERGRVGGGEGTALAGCVGRVGDFSASRST
jgi:hypothetical protein